MIADLGYVAILTAFLASIYAPIAAFYGIRNNKTRWVESARNAIFVIFLLVALACGLLVILLLTSDFSITYVWEVSSRDMPAYLKVAALWGGQRGSILFFNFMLTAFTAAAMARNWDNERGIMPYAVIVGSFTLIFFLGLTLLMENPFERIGAATAEGSGFDLLISTPVTYVKNLFVRPGIVPEDGQGMRALLRHPAMIIHPPMLYLGYTGFTVPFVFAMAALMAGKFNEGWIRITRRWTLVAWLFLGLGVVLGGRWAYDVLGWGGYWAWDAVENSSLLPWLTGTAFLHSVMIQEKRGMFKGWNVGLIIITYLLVVLGTLNVRGGLVSSVHAFAQSNIGWLLLAFLAYMIIFSIVLVYKRRDQLQSENHIRSFLSRETAFLGNNLLFLLIAAVTFFGTYYTVPTELFTGQKVTLGIPYYEKVNGPLFGALLLLMGIAPLMMWYRTSIGRLRKMTVGPAAGATVIVIAMFILGIRNWIALLGYWIISFSAFITLLEFGRAMNARVRSKGENPFAALAALVARNRRRYGGYVIHLGVLTMAMGIISTELYQQQTQMRLARDESLSIGDYTMVFKGIEQRMGNDDAQITEALVDVYRGDKLVRTLKPRTEFFTRTGENMSIPAVRMTPTEDFYVLLINWEGMSQNAATFRAYVNPLINWVWFGAFIFIFGTLIAAWPDPADEKVTAMQSSGGRLVVGGVSGD
ncbi:MAG TPA: heme lyase CcmF/NrfE family subunit [candidate division Zixibacteria bacterium]|nr:heme lyase CcmF/NrfE family subunit [candidate division Zixibacteria bacterium]